MDAIGTKTGRTHNQRRLLLLATGAACLLLCGLMALPMLCGYVHLADDLGAFHLPLRAFYAQQLKLGQPFDWMPGLFAGFYLTGEGQVGGYHPLHLVLYRGLPLESAFGLELLLSYPLMLIGTFLLFHRHVKPAAAALFGALVFTFCGFNTLHFVHPNAIAVVAHLPWLLWCIDLAFHYNPKRERGRSSHNPKRERGLFGVLPRSRFGFRLFGTTLFRHQRLAAEVGLVLLTASQLLLGYPQYVWMSLLTEVAYLLWVIRSSRVSQNGDEKRSRAVMAYGRPLIFLGGLLALGLVIAAVQVLPTYAALATSQRSEADGQFAHTGALHLVNILQLIQPYQFQDRVLGGNTHEFGLYLGAVPLLLLVWLALRWPHLRRSRNVALAALTLAAVALVLSLGRSGGIYYLQTWLPVVGSFRFPARYLVLVHLGLAAAVAVAMSDLLRVARRSKPMTKESLRPLWHVAPASLILAVAAGVMLGRFTAWWPLALAGPLLLADAAWLIARSLRGTRLALLGLVMLTAVDLGVYGFSYAMIHPIQPLAAVLEKTWKPPQEGSRIAAQLRDPQTEQLRRGNQLLLGGWTQVDGYAGLEPQRKLNYRKLASLRVAGVHYVARRDVTADIEGLERIDARWLRVPNPLPRAYLVSNMSVSDNPNRDLSQIKLEQTALVEQALKLAGGETGDAQIVSDRPGRIEVATTTDGPQLLVALERYTPDWRAEIDGAPGAVLRVNGEFLGCRVPGGRHQVRFIFDPDSLRYGRWISVAGLLGLFILAAARLTPGRFPKRRVS